MFSSIQFLLLCYCTLYCKPLSVNTIIPSLILYIFPIAYFLLFPVSYFLIHRYGQTRPVHVYRLLNRGRGVTEEIIYKNSVQKESMSAQVVDADVVKHHFTKG